MTDAELTRRWRNTERYAEASMALAVMLMVTAILHDWPDWIVIVTFVPLWFSSAAAHIARRYVLRGMMARRGLDWNAPIWWVR